MQSPKKGLLCNLNHAHLQHISLGLHLSRHPELREDTDTLALPRTQTACPDCQEHRNGPELVDANSNNPSLLCRCCDAHPLQSRVKQVLQTQAPLPNRPALKHEEEEEEEEEEEAGSPSDPASSSVSSCSDLSLDDSPVSVYCKAFPAEEAQSPENQPNIVPLEDAHHDLPLASCKERGTNLNIQREPRPASQVWDSPDSLCSSSSLESASEAASPSPQSPDEAVLAETCRAPPPGPPPARPCRAPPAVPVPSAGAALDSNCNALVAQEARTESLSSGPVDINSNQAPPPRPKRASAPPPVPPRTKRGLQGLRRGEAAKPTPAAAPPELPSRQPGPEGDVSRKNITSFHELAQKRKKVGAVPPPGQARKDQSDWLIVFSPDTELPPSHELAWGSTLCPGAAGSLPSQPELANPAGCLQRGVTTFKELRYRKQKGQPTVQPLQRAEVEKGAPEDLEAPANGHLWAPKDIQPWRKKPRPGLQPIVEGAPEEGEDGGSEQELPGRVLQGPPNGKRDPWMPGREETGDRHFKEVRAPPTHPTQPRPPQPLLVHFSVVDGQPAEFPRPPSLCPSLESVELASPEPTGPAFCPRLKTLSCEEVCLLASRQGQVFGTLSPEELFPIRLSPIGAHSPPARSALPFLDSPELAVLFSPFFPRSRTFPALAFPPCQVPELPIGAPGPLDSRAGPAGPRSVSWGSMGAKESGPPEQLRHSQSFAGVPSTDHPWRADTDQVFAQLREQKKALLVAISASVDKIVAHFSTARNLVQKAQLGDSRLSPDVGYLILNSLCPALRALVSDGLKPFQKDVITGQRPSSPWSVVEASAKPGPQARSLNALYWRVSRLAPLRSKQQRFHAFILGLLNMKQLEQWFSHLQRNSELISALYLPTAFLVLSQGFCRRWADELLLLLQPLSMLTFQLDLLFEHHHLSLDVRPMPRQAATPPEPPPSFRQAAGPRRPDSSGCQVPLVRQEEGPLAQSSPLHQPPLHQRLLQWGGRLTHTLRGHEPGPKPEPCTQAVQQETEDKPCSWREQLGWPSEASGSCSASRQEGFPYTHWTKLRMALGEVIKEVHGGTGEAAASSGALPQTPSPGESHPEAPRKASASLVTGHSPGAEPRRELATPPLGTVEAEEAEGTPEGGDAPGSGKAAWLGWLFGANYPGASNEPNLSAPKPSRRPSSWLPPTMNVLALVMKTAPPEKSWQEDSWEHSGPDPLQAYRAVRALCDHAGSGAGHLSFRKGDVLQVLDTVDEDWIQCCHGDRKGLVPIGYTSLIL